MNFDLKRPCGDCPLRSDIRAYLTADRAEEIADVLLSDGTFTCHKTVDYSECSDGENTKKTQHCAGAMIMLERMNRPNQLMRIAERFGDYDRHQLDMSSPVFDDPSEFILACEEAVGPR